MKVVFDIGGSILVPDKPDVGEFKERGEQVSRISRDHDPLVVVGGGKAAREYIEAGSTLGSDETFLDMLGIEVSRLNAKLLIKSIGEVAHSSVIKDFDRAKEVFLGDGVPVMGGTHPGHTTDAVTALVGEYIDADLLVVVSNVDGVYDKDPKKNESAKKFNRISSDKLQEISMKSELGAGISAPIDPLAARIIGRTGIKTILVGKDESLIDVVKGDHNGTEINSKG